MAWIGSPAALGAAITENGAKASRPTDLIRRFSLQQKQFLRLHKIHTRRQTAKINAAHKPAGVEGRIVQSGWTDVLIQSGDFPSEKVVDL